MPSLIVGLGNPGSEYARTRHNVGFWVVDLLADRLKADAFRDKFGASWTKAGDLYLCKPQTYMNLSGEPTQQLCHFFKIDTPNVVVVHDELDFDPGVVRLKKGGGAGGHNGLKSLIACIGEGFSRVRMGVGKPKGNGANWVLSVPPKDEMASLEEATVRAADAAEGVLKHGIVHAMNLFNR